MVSRRCECGKRIPCYGFLGQTSGEAKWCSVCPTRPPETFNIMRRRCECGATATPKFGLQGWEAHEAKCGSTAVLLNPLPAALPYLDPF